MKKLFEEIIQNVPDYKAFLTVDEMDRESLLLAEQYPDVVSIFEMGKTRENHPLYCLKIGKGKKNALMFGCPHPNEPIGTMMLKYLTETLATNEALRAALDYTFYIVKAWDADGTKLNEKWFKGPFTLHNYARNFFRPAGHQQVDWTFPIDYKKLHFHDVIPEAKAMMDLIDELQPTFIYSLHNAGFGGVYWYMTKDIPAVYDALKEAARKQGVPLSLGEPEAPYLKAFAPAVFENLGIEEDYDYLEKYGIPHPEEEIKCGTCSAGYAKGKYGSFTLLTELPYFYDKRIGDLSASHIKRKEAILKNLDESEKWDGFIKEQMAGIQAFTAPKNPFRLALEAFTDLDKSREAQRKMVETEAEYEKNATVAEAFDNLLISQFYKSLSLGLLLRLAETELEKMKEKGEQNPSKSQQLQKVFEKAQEALDTLCAQLEKDIDYEVVPIKKLVSIQLECGLIVADYLQNQ